jgi:hypothetical protein
MQCGQGPKWGAEISQNLSVAENNHCQTIPSPLPKTYLFAHARFGGEQPLV